MCGCLAQKDYREAELCLQHWCPEEHRERMRFAVTECAAIDWSGAVLPAAPSPHQGLPAAAWKACKCVVAGWHVLLRPPVRQSTGPPSWVMRCPHHTVVQHSATRSCCPRALCVVKLLAAGSVTNCVMPCTSSDLVRETRMSTGMDAHALTLPSVQMCGSRPASDAAPVHADPPDPFPCLSAQASGSRKRPRWGMPWPRSR